MALARLSVLSLRYLPCGNGFPWLVLIYHDLSWCHSCVKNPWPSPNRSGAHPAASVALDSVALFFPRFVVAALILVFRSVVSVAWQHGYLFVYFILRGPNENIHLCICIIFLACSFLQHIHTILFSNSFFRSQHHITRKIFSYFTLTCKLLFLLSFENLNHKILSDFNFSKCFPLSYTCFRICQNNQ